MEATSEIQAAIDHLEEARREHRQAGGKHHGLNVVIELLQGYLREIEQIGST